MIHLHCDIPFFLRAHIGPFRIGRMSVKFIRSFAGGSLIPYADWVRIAKLLVMRWQMVPKLGIKHTAPIEPPTSNGNCIGICAPCQILVMRLSPSPPSARFDSIQAAAGALNDKQADEWHEKLTEVKIKRAHVCKKLSEN